MKPSKPPSTTMDLPRLDRPVISGVANVEKAAVGSVRPLAGVSIIIPVGPHDNAWRSLLRDLAVISPNAEIVLAAAAPEPADLHRAVQLTQLECPVRWITAPLGRAVQLNAGAELATGQHLWFLHADSSIGCGGLLALDGAVKQRPEALHYFDLAFDSESMRLLRLNEWGVWIRSRFLSMPFGDQGLCLNRQGFERLGRFSERAPYGEDHLFVWAARRDGIQVVSVGAVLATSGRKYDRGGWLATTALHTWRTWRQALPEAWKLLTGRH